MASYSRQVPTSRQVELVDLSNTRSLRAPSTSVQKTPSFSSPTPPQATPATSSLLAERSSQSSSSPPSSRMTAEQREDMFRQCLSSSCVDVDELRRIVWAHGIPCTYDMFSSNVPYSSAKSSLSSWVRPLTWKLLCGYLPPERSEWAPVLAANRARYWAAVHDATIDPSARPVDGDHPLNDSDTSQWREFFRDADVRALIARDAQRTHADLHDIHGRIRDPLERLLFVYAKNHPNPGYRQGMNELAAPFLIVFAQEIKNKSAMATGNQHHYGGEGNDFDYMSSISDVGMSGVDESDVEADAYFCFCKIMKEMVTCYVQDTPTPPASTSSSNSVINPNLSPLHATEALPTLSPSPSVHQQGIGRQLRELQALLRIKDPDLEGKLDSLGIDPRFYGLRWIRLWLSHEFKLPDCLSLWDSFLTAEVRLPWIRYVCIAMLIRIRENLLAADFTKCMKLLLNYPQCDVSQLLRIADRLRTSNAVIVRTARS